MQYRVCIGERSDGVGRAGLDGLHGGDVAVAVGVGWLAAAAGGVAVCPGGAALLEAVHGDGGAAGARRRVGPKRPRRPPGGAFEVPGSGGPPLGSPSGAVGTILAPRGGCGARYPWRVREPAGVRGDLAATPRTEGRDDDGAGARSSSPPGRAHRRHGSPFPGAPSFFPFFPTRLPPFSSAYSI